MSAASLFGPLGTAVFMAAGREAIAPDATIVPTNCVTLACKSEGKR